MRVDYQPLAGQFQKGTDEMIKDLKLKVFPTRELRVLTVEAGKLGVRVV